MTRLSTRLRSKYARTVFLVLIAAALIVAALMFGPCSAVRDGPGPEERMGPALANERAEAERAAAAVAPSDSELESPAAPTDSLEHGEADAPPAKVPTTSEPAYGTVILRSQSGTLREAKDGDLVAISVYSERRARGTFVGPAKWTLADGEWVGRVRVPFFDPLDRMLVQIHGCDPVLFRWTITQATLTPQSPEVTSICCDGAGVLKLRFELSESEESLRDLQVFVHRSNGVVADGFTTTSTRRGRAPASVAQARDVELDACWIVYVEGFQPVFGNLSHLVATRAAGEEVRIRVDLIRGWGCLVQCTTTSSDPLAGALVRAGGRIAGTTDRAGRFLLLADSQVDVEVSPNGVTWTNASDHVHQGLCPVSLRADTR